MLIVFRISVPSILIVILAVLAIPPALAESPIADAGPDIEVMEGETFTLDGSGSTDDGGIVSWVWTIMESIDVVVGLESGETVTMTLGPGTYNVTLRVRDAEGNEGYDHLTLVVRRADAPVADAGPDATVEAGDGHTFDATGTTSVPPIESYKWWFQYGGENIDLEGVAPTFTFYIPGTYVVNMVVNNTMGHADWDTVTITVVDTTAPVPSIEVTREESSERRKLDGDGSTDAVGIVNWSWRIVFENEITDLYGETVDLHRSDPGRYNVTLTVRDAAGNEASDSIEFTIEGDDDGPDLLWIAVIAVVVVVTVVTVMFAMGMNRPKAEE